MAFYGTAEPPEVWQPPRWALDEIDDLEDAIKELVTKAIKLSQEGKEESDEFDAVQDEIGEMRVRIDDLSDPKWYMVQDEADRAEQIAIEKGERY